MTIPPEQKKIQPAVALSEELLVDLYVRLRRDLQRWAQVTKQTPQPRMGYVGQHLVSVVTSYPGGRSGARGDDLKLPNGEVAEIKCCYRVDQLGKCRQCGTAVAAIEKTCPNEECGSDDLVRKDDSKWLLSPRNEQELRELFLPTRYYFVLFEFADIQLAEDINVCIYEVNPKSLGFSLCMIDYYFNIRAHSASKAPFNLWPHSPKFLMMKPRLIYQSVIMQDDSITTMVFPERDQPELYALDNLDTYASSDTFTEPAIDTLAKMREIDCSSITLPKTDIQRRRMKLKLLQSAREKNNWCPNMLADDLARAVYKSRLIKQPSWIKEFAPTM